jgi:glycolate oxidase iron-sulfur subunit
MTQVPTATQVASSPAIGKKIDYELFLDCVHCGLCTSACPTYVELGTEMDSPRGRIYLMRGVVDGRIPLDADVKKHLDLCLNCRACESACPSGVQYGRLLEPFRNDLVAQEQAAERMPWWQRFTVFHIFPYRWRARMALAPVKLLQWLHLDRALGTILPKRMRQMMEMLPRMRSLPALPEFLPAEGTKRATVALLTGCVNDVVFRQVNWATAKVLQKNGVEVWTPRSQGCCGALHLHAGKEAKAKAFASDLCQAIMQGPKIDAIVVNVAGCGSTLKDYAHLLADTTDSESVRLFQAKVKDVHEFLMELGPIKPTHALKLRATYHDACHLCHAQKIRSAPRELLKMIPGLELAPLNESELCCGAAGSYNLSQPEMAERLGERKAKNVLTTNCNAVFTGNAGCLLQIGKHLRSNRPDVWVAHPVEALLKGYGMSIV